MMRRSDEDEARQEDNRRDVARFAEELQSSAKADVVDRGKSRVSASSLLSNLPTPARSARLRDGGGQGGGGSGSCSGALEEIMRRQGVDEAWTALEDMQRRGAPADKYTVCRMLTKTVGEGRNKLNHARVYRSIGLVERFVETQPQDVDEVLFNALLDTCCRLKDLKRLEATMAKMQELRVVPSPVTLGVLVKTYGQAGDLQKVLQVWEDMDKQRCQANAVTYGCMIDACVKCGSLEKAVEVFEGMRRTGKHRNTILYTTLIKGYGSDKDLQSAMGLFREMSREGVQYNTITYNSILDACVKCGDLSTAESLLQEMISPQSSVEPDLITFSTLLKGYCHLGDMDRALQVSEAIKVRGLRCDELVYNTLMDGCVKAGDYSAGIGLFEEMVQTGMRPSAITHSILARLYQRAGYDEDAPEAVAQLYHHVGVERPIGGASTNRARTGSGGSGGGGGSSSTRRNTTSGCFGGRRGSGGADGGSTASTTSARCQRERQVAAGRMNSLDGSWQTWCTMPPADCFEGAGPSMPSQLLQGLAQSSSHRCSASSSSRPGSSAALSCQHAATMGHPSLSHGSSMQAGLHQPLHNGGIAASAGGGGGMLGGPAMQGGWQQMMSNQALAMNCSEPSNMGTFMALPSPQGDVGISQQAILVPYVLSHHQASWDCVHGTHQSAMPWSMPQEANPAGFSYGAQHLQAQEANPAGYSSYGVQHLQAQAFFVPVGAADAAQGMLLT